jgi:thiopurine S-methyltransferase
MHLIRPVAAFLVSFVMSTPSSPVPLPPHVRTTADEEESATSVAAPTTTAAGTADESSERLARWKSRVRRIESKTVPASRASFMGPPVRYVVASSLYLSFLHFPFDDLFSLQWDELNIAWHNEQVHESLVRFGDRIIDGWSAAAVADESACPAPASSAAASASERIGRPGARVFFPLCGKSVDMAALAEHPSVSQVVGVDGIRAALDEFGAENPDLGMRWHDGGGEAPISGAQFDRLVGRKMLLLKGDFFELDETATDGRFDAVFDRGSLVAIEPSLRRDYVQVIRRLVKPGGKVLLVVIERTSGNEADDLTAGPPFSVPEAEVRSLYETQEWVQSVTLLEDEGEKERNEGRAMRSLFFLVEARS